MNNRVSFAGFALTVAALALPTALHAQGPQPATKAGFTVDEALAKRGKTVWVNRGCMGCHTIGKGPLAGPDLAGVIERRDLDWLKRWLKDTEQMLATDSLAQALLKEYKNTRMPNLRLSDADIDALLNFIAQESEKIKK